MISITERIYRIYIGLSENLVLQPPMVYRNFPVKHCHQFGGGIPPFETHTSTLLKHWGTPFHATAHHHHHPPPPPRPQPPPPHLFQHIWVCVRIGYIPNYSHLIGIMISNILTPKKWSKPLDERTKVSTPSPSRVPRHAAPSQRVRRSSRPKPPSWRRPVERNDV